VQALKATLVVTGPDGSRSVAAQDFFVDLLESDLRSDEILTAIEIPVSSNGAGSCYLKFEHPASGYAVCGAAAIVSVDEDGRCREAALSLNGVAATPVMVTGIGSALSGSTLGEDDIDRAVDDNLSVSDPMGDIYASAPYRVHLAHVYAKRALKMARDRARA
jgi:carbon-monoxide dehydrogenase medium subunit